MTSLQTLEQSLTHWQAVYIVAVSAAVLSAVAIVIFAFHFRRESGLKISNYLYVTASLLAVISTLAIVVKTRSVDAEKDRVADVRTKQDEKQIADALKVGNLALDTATQAVTASGGQRGETQELKEELAQEKEQRDALEQQLQWRHLTSKQEDTILSVLSTAPPGTRVLVGTTSPDPEITQYADEFAQILARAKWSVVGRPQQPFGQYWGHSPIGLTMWCGTVSCLGEGNILRKALLDAGIEVIPSRIPDSTPDLLLIVGERVPTENKK